MANAFETGKAQGLTYIRENNPGAGDYSAYGLIEATSQYKRAASQAKFLEGWNSIDPSKGGRSEQAQIADLPIKEQSQDPNFTNVSTDALTIESKRLTETRLMWLSGHISLTHSQVTEMDARGKAAAAELAKRYAEPVYHDPQYPRVEGEQETRCATCGECKPASTFIDGECEMCHNAPTLEEAPTEAQPLTQNFVCIQCKREVWTPSSGVCWTCLDKQLEEKHASQAKVPQFLLWNGRNFVSCSAMEAERLKLAGLDFIKHDGAWISEKEPERHMAYRKQEEIQALGYACEVVEEKKRGFEKSWCEYRISIACSVFEVEGSPTVKASVEAQPLSPTTPEDAICDQCTRARALWCEKCKSFTCMHYSLWSGRDAVGADGEQLIHRCNWCTQELVRRGDGDYAGMQEATVAKEEQDEQLQAGIPIADEYCWQHTSLSGGGGWFCVQCALQTAWDALQECPSYCEREDCEEILNIDMDKEREALYSHVYAEFGIERSPVKSGDLRL